ncbi:hypothetical protein CD928_05805 [Sphingopyxis sp. GW247-27LB]|nr:hypothetical protein CD928_05805 [Sphingopyxis sp. GW247-27LB]
MYREWDKRRKQVTMNVTVSVPRNMSAAETRREVREMIKNGAGWHFNCGEEGGVTVRRVRPAS